MTKEIKRQWIVFGAGLLAFWGNIVLREKEMIVGNMVFPFFLISYSLLGYILFRHVLRNIEKKQYFNENILIVMASAGAVGIGRYTEGNLIMMLFAFAGIMEDMLMKHSRNVINKLMDMQPTVAVKKVRGKEYKVAPELLKIRDTVVVKPGERIPVDGVVTTGETTVDSRMLTGEMIPQTAREGDRVYGGSINLTGVIEIRVIRTYQESTLSRIRQMVDDAGGEDTENTTMTGRFMWKYIPAVIMLAVAVAVVPPLTFSWGQWHEWIYRAFLFLIAACPCGLLISEPIAFLGGISAAAKHGVIIKGGRFLEYLTEADVFIFDKTGTLTEGVFEVTEVHPTEITTDELLKYAAYAESYSNHPIAKSLQRAYGHPIDKKQVQWIKETAGLGVSATVEGKRVHIGNRRMAKKHGAEYEQVESGGTVLHVVVDDRYAGYIVAEDTIKEEAYDLIEWLQKKVHALTVMLTGDRRSAALHVARKLNIDYAYAGLLPKDKLEQLEHFQGLKEENEKVVFVGDGMNDAIVLKKADVGVAMGALGCDAAIEAADIVLLEDDLSRLAGVIGLSRETCRVVKGNIRLAMFVKIVALILAGLKLATLRTILIVDLAVMFVGLLNALLISKYPME